MLYIKRYWPGVEREGAAPGRVHPAQPPPGPASGRLYYITVGLFVARRRILGKSGGALGFAGKSGNETKYVGLFVVIIW